MFYILVVGIFFQCLVKKKYFVFRMRHVIILKSLNYECDMIKYFTLWDKGDSHCGKVSRWTINSIKKQTLGRPRTWKNRKS